MMGSYRSCEMMSCQVPIFREPWTWIVYWNPKCDHEFAVRLTCCRRNRRLRWTFRRNLSDDCEKMSSERTTMFLLNGRKYSGNFWLFRMIFHFWRTRHHHKSLPFGMLMGKIPSHWLGIVYMFRLHSNNREHLRFGWRFFEYNSCWERSKCAPVSLAPAEYLNYTIFVGNHFRQLEKCLLVDDYQKSCWWCRWIRTGDAIWTHKNIYFSWIRSFSGPFQRYTLTFMGYSILNWLFAHTHKIKRLIDWNGFQNHSLTDLSRSPTAEKSIFSSSQLFQPLGKRKFMYRNVPI